jgi:glucose-1-phosphate cytidylyltransferase
VKTLVLCGGMGTRAYPLTSEIPKPLIEVGGAPMLLHVMRIYALFGFDEFVLAAGYRAELVKKFAANLSEPWSVTVVDTGLHTNTAARIERCSDLLSDTFLCTYADGLSDIDITKLVSFHRSHNGSATVTSVPLQSQYGTLELDEAGRVNAFQEKPRLSEYQISGGFFVFDHSGLARCTGDDLERDILPALSSTGDLFAYRHDGFWRSLDTYKDVVELGRLTDGRRAPWIAELA